VHYFQERKKATHLILIETALLSTVYEKSGERFNILCANLVVIKNQKQILLLGFFLPEMDFFI
jgi:hypothetical protein